MSGSVVGAVPPSEADAAYDPADGPRLVRGVRFVADEQGVVSEATRPVVAVCRCEASARTPWCDGTHRLLARRTRDR